MSNIEELLEELALYFEDFIAACDRNDIMYTEDIRQEAEDRLREINAALGYSDDEEG